MKTIAAVFAIVFLAATLPSCADPLVENANLVKDLKTCEKCSLSATSKHDCGKTAHCSKCLTDANKEKRMYAEQPWAVNADKTASCKTCKTVVGVPKQ